MVIYDQCLAQQSATCPTPSAAAHLFGHINFGDLQSTQKYGKWQAYGQSKLANVLFTYELARRLNPLEVTANALHPGVVNTELQVRYCAWRCSCGSFCFLLFLQLHTILTVTWLYLP